MDYGTSEVCRPWQNTVYTLIMRPSAERRGEMAVTGGDGLLELGDTYLLSPSPRPTVAIVGGRLTSSGPPSTFMAMSCTSSTESGL